MKRIQTLNYEDDYSVELTVDGATKKLAKPFKHYNLRLKVKGKASGEGGVKDHRVNTMSIIVENFDSELLDSTEFKYFLVRWRRGGWRAATLSRSTTNAIRTAGLDSFAVTAREQAYTDLYDLPLATRTNLAGTEVHFKNTRLTTQKIGFAIYRNTGEGTHGWQRVSNIAYIQLSVKKNGSWRYAVKQE